MHRDIKPHNILFDNINKNLTIIDWGLAEFYKEGLNYNTKVSALYYKAPEILLDYKTYDCSLDIWSLGCIFATLIFKIEPFFSGKDTADQLLKIAKIIGTDDIYEYIREKKIKVPEIVYDQLGK
jgi:casein kinase II subunit alpha